MEAYTIEIERWIRENDTSGNDISRFQYIVIINVHEHIFETAAEGKLL
jgi:hypothetical protein